MSFGEEQKRAIFVTDAELDRIEVVLDEMQMYLFHAKAIFAAIHGNDLSESALHSIASVCEKSFDVMGNEDGNEAVTFLMDLRQRWKQHDKVAERNMAILSDFLANGGELK